MISLASIREAQARWRATSLSQRLQVIREVRAGIARAGVALARAAGAPRGRPLRETLTAEVIPLAAACKYLEQNARAILKTRVAGRKGRPVWLEGVTSQVLREPFGIVLIVGPANYPLFLPGVQMLQALAAGNGVLIKPGRHGAAAVAQLITLCREAGLPGDLVQLLPEDPASVYEAMDAGVNLVVFTGSSAIGREVLIQAASRTIPVIAELSGNDAAIVREDADLHLAERALRFGKELNDGDSCIAPRRLVAKRQATDFLSSTSPTVVLDESADDEALVAAANDSPFALGASLFTRDTIAGRKIAEKLNAGMVTINDCIMPTADPRLPFGGRDASGYGTTRGAEGLLALTRPKVITIQRGKRRHLLPPVEGDEAFFLSYLEVAHSRGAQAKAAGLWRLLTTAAKVFKV